jgi:hypothetical protein
MFKNISLVIKILFLCYFLLILSNIEISKIKINIINIELIYILLSFSFFHYLRSIKLKIFFNLKLYNSIKIYLIGFFFGFITPGRVGDFIKIFYVRKKINFKDFKKIVYEKIIDVYWILMFSCISIIFLFNLNIYNQIISLIFFVFLTVLLHKFIISKLEIKLKLYEIFKANILSILSLFFYLIGCFFIFKNFDIKIGPEIFMVFILALGVTLVPISFNGLGSREAVFLFFINIINLNKEEIIIASFLIFIFINVLFSICGYFFYTTNPNIKIDKKLILKFSRKII